MKKAIFCLAMASLMSFGSANAQNLDSAPYKAGVDPNIDMYISSWKHSVPRHTHGSLIERDILTMGDPMAPKAPGAVLQYINRYVYAMLAERMTTQPVTLDGEQEILYIAAGNGTITANGTSHDLKKGIAVLIPAGLEFTMTNTGDETLAMYLICEPIPRGFRPNDDLVVRDENTATVSGTTGHWVHIVRPLFKTDDGLGTLESIITVSFDPMTIGHPHSHEAGVEEVWTQIEGESVAFIGKQIRTQPVGTAYMIPPDGETPHSNINESDKQVKLLYFARYGDHEVRP